MVNEKDTITIGEIIKMAKMGEEDTLILQNKSGRKMEEWLVKDITPGMKKTKCVHARMHAGGKRYNYNW